MLKKAKGITLISLIITIIVMLILAGVSISMVVGNNGVLEQAQEAVTKTEEARVAELKETAKAAAAMNVNGQTYESDGYTAIIPAGYAVSNDEDERSIANGLVVVDTEGNEFVWIPVGSSEDYVRTKGTNNYYMTSSGGVGTIDQMVQYDVLGLTSILGIEITDGTLNMPELEVILNAGGFYVSRYEMGIESVERSGAQSGWTTDDIYSKPGLEPVRNIYQSVAKELANTWKVSGNVQSGLITGTQWDTMCNFIGWEVTDTDCTSWGNYYNNKSKEYKSVFTSDSGNSNWLERTSFARTTTDGTEKYVFPTGTFVGESGITTYAKNIADVAGNVWEWTTEVPYSSASNAVIRGGSAYYYGSSHLATSRYGGASATTLADWYVGFRLVLYVK